MANIELRDFLNYRFLHGVKASPDSSKAAFVVTQADLENNTYRHDLWLWQDGAARPLTDNGTSDAFLWEDPEHLLLPVPNKGTTVWERLDISTGGRTEAFTLPFFVKSMQRLNDATWFFTARKGKAPDRGCTVVETLPIRINGMGYSSGAVSSLYTYNVTTGEIKQISPDNFAVNHAAAYKGNLIYSGAEKRRIGAKYSDIHLFDVSAGTDAVIYDKKDLAVLDLREVGGQIMVTARDQIRFSFDQNPTFYRLDMENKEYVPVCFPDLNLENSALSDSIFGMASPFGGDGKHLYFIATVNSNVHLKRLDIEGNLTDVCTNPGAINCFDIAADGTVYGIAQYGMVLSELYTLGEHPKKLTDLNGEFLAGKTIVQPRPMSVTACGETIDGWVMPPAGFDPSKKYPAVLEIHGGPKNVFSEVYYHELQVLAAAGYFVIFCNPIGSDGKGTHFFEAIRNRYGTLDYESLMAFEEAAVAAYPQIDAKRIAVTGGSYGGFMTNWVIGHTDRFACAVSQRSISNMISFWGTADVGYNSVTDKNGGDIFHAEQLLWEQSPVKYADRVKTPTLFLHSDEDYRCPLEQGIQMYTAVTVQGVDTRLVIFKGENHSLSRSGKPANRIRRLEEMLAWIRKYTAEA